MDKDEKFQKTALFRYALIAPAVTDTFEAPSLAQYFRNVAAKKHLDPDGNYVEVTFHSLERWLCNYRKSGLAGITPKTRIDQGKPRALADGAIKRIRGLKEQFPYITGKAIYGRLIEEGMIDASGTSLATVHRFIKNNGMDLPPKDAKAVKAFEMEFANDCLQADSSNALTIKASGKKARTFIIGFLDDASRMAVHAQLYMNDNAVNMQDSFRQAIAKFGAPKRLFVDNGGSYNNLQLQLICASLGIALIHARPYMAKSKGIWSSRGRQPAMGLWPSFLYRAPISAFIFAGLSLYFAWSSLILGARACILILASELFLVRGKSRIFVTRVRRMIATP